jgi:hypothetical protein
MPAGGWRGQIGALEVVAIVSIDQELIVVPATEVGSAGGGAGGAVGLSAFQFNDLA